eukprot:c15935_g1_i1.p1 GENE.c15935_g1_i1~~c15935_g1_i1.p1  ORF type:complete len:257 (+),score=61.25 c15935_g1_i1:46-771(+)
MSDKEDETTPIEVRKARRRERNKLNSVRIKTLITEESLGKVTQQQAASNSSASESVATDAPAETSCLCNTLVPQLMKELAQTKSRLEFHQRATADLLGFIQSRPLVEMCHVPSDLPNSVAKLITRVESLEDSLQVAQKKSEEHMNQRLYLEELVRELRRVVGAGYSSDTELFEAIREVQRARSTQLATIEELTNQLHAYKLREDKSRQWWRRAGLWGVSVLSILVLFRLQQFSISQPLTST